jgi:hypothetical protein
LWGQGEDWAMWFGVMAKQGFVAKLELSNNNLTGTRDFWLFFRGIRK